MRVLPVRADGGRDGGAGGASGLPAPRFVLPTGGGIGYGGFALDAAQPARTCSHHLPEIGDPLTRGSAVGHAVGRRCSTGASAPAAFMATSRCAALPRESDELNVAADARLRAAGLLDVPAAPARAMRARAALERLLRDGPRRTRTTPSLKSAWFSALRDTAQTPADARVARARLAKDGDGAGPDARRARLHHAGAGARRPRGAGVEGDPRRAARRGSKNPDRKARFAFVRPALSADPADA